MSLIKKVINSSKVDFSGLTDDELVAIKNAIDTGEDNAVAKIALLKLIEEDGIDFSNVDDETLIEVSKEYKKYQKSKNKPLVEDVIGSSASVVAGAATGLTYGLPQSRFAPKRIKEQIDILKEEYPNAFEVGDIAGSIVSPVSKLGAATRLSARALKSAGIAASESATRGFFEDKSAKDTMKQAETSALVAGGLTTAFGTIGKLASKTVGRLFSGLKEDLAEVYSASKKYGDISSRKFAQKLKEKAFKNYKNLSDFIENKDKEISELLAKKKEMLKNISSPEYKNELINIVEKHKRDLFLSRESFLPEYKQEKEAYLKYLDKLSSQIDETLEKYKSKENVSLYDLEKFKEDLYDKLKYDRITHGIATDATTLSGTKVGVFEPTKYLMHNIARDIKEFVYKEDENFIDRMYGKRKDLIKINKEEDISNISLRSISKKYENVQKIKETMPKQADIIKMNDEEALSNIAYKTNEWRDLFKETFEKDLSAQRQLSKSKQIVDLIKARDNIRGSEYIGTIGIKATPRIPGHSALMKIGSVAGELAGETKQKYPTIYSATTKTSEFVTPKLFSKRPGEVFAERYAETNPDFARDALETVFVGKTEAKELPQPQQDDKWFTDLISKNPEQIQIPMLPELEKNIPIERSYSAVKRNAHIIIPKLKQLDVNTGIMLENALRSEDTKSVEGILAIYAQNPIFEQLFQPSPVKTSVGDAKSAVIVPNNKARIVNKFERNIISQDIIKSDFSETEKMKKIDELNKTGTISLD